MHTMHVQLQKRHVLHPPPNTNPAYIKHAHPIGVVPPCHLQNLIHR